MKAKRYPKVMGHVELLKQLKQLLSNGMTQVELAKKLGMSQSSISAYANGKRKKVSLEHAQKIEALILSQKKQFLKNMPKY